MERGNFDGVVGDIVMCIYLVLFFMRGDTGVSGFRSSDLKYRYIIYMWLV